MEQLEAHQAGRNPSNSTITMPLLPPKTSSQELLEAEVKDLKNSLAKLEKEYRKDKDNLNSEVNQLELLVEAKIFREGELESQIEDLKRALAHAKRTSSSTSDNEASHGISEKGDTLPQARINRNHDHDGPRKSKSTIKPNRGSVLSIISASIDNQEDAGEIPSGRRSASQYSEEDLDDGLCEICKEDHAVEVSHAVHFPSVGIMTVASVRCRTALSLADPYPRTLRTAMIGRSTRVSKIVIRLTAMIVKSMVSIPAVRCLLCSVVPAQLLTGVSGFPNSTGHDLANCPLADEVF